MIIECRAVSDVGNALERFAFPIDGNGIYAGFWAKLILKIDIGRGKTEKFSAAVATGYDLSSRTIPTTIG